jgi:hypothetical protein
MERVETAASRKGDSELELGRSRMALAYHGDLQMELFLDLLR